MRDDAMVRVTKETHEKLRLLADDQHRNIKTVLELLLAPALDAEVAKLDRSNSEGESK